MPRIIAYFAASIDGFIASPSGSVDWLGPHDDALAGFAEFRETLGAAIIGRTTFDSIRRGPWPYEGLPVVLLTNRPCDPLLPGVHAFAGSPQSLLEQLIPQVGGDIWLIGGAQVLGDFAAADLIDIWRVCIIPTVLGQGVPALAAKQAAQNRLRLLGHRSYKSGAMELIYERSVT
jgi:dihydrofolate reductase